MVSYGGKLILALIALAVGLKLIKFLLKTIKKGLEKSSVDKSLYSFLMSATKITLYVVLVISIASMLGADMTSFIALVGSAGLAVGLALQGSLSNLAGGVLILFLRPFKAGDYIEVAGHSGTVEDVQLFYTILNTPDNKRIFIPNGELANSSSVNYSAHSTRRVDFKFGVGYEDDILKVKKILNKIAENHELVLQDPAPQVFLSEHGDSSVNFSLRLWCKTEDYWKIYFEIMEIVKLEFDKEGINIPYPQMDVHLINK
ncbi:mechanosensitive ion channel family protein [Oceanirhabdus sp. W0125-5]|uniref:mechanosensitive ion channel family protein n=1 Tax=Oceanirhabdus sp. W0125-5 TaxID=2999116 RepID=UPI0022F2AF01|nr:mechanosensitive ion channel domain-containing protein [Oceanirhabdus sp. W0125-5]WBW99755.1 mechanosensitive ion channel [Oceanirhabdus sp. W0125-5]